jgi:hypothetical protein
MADKEEMKPEPETQQEKEEKQKERIADKLIKIAIEKSYRDSDSRPNAGGLFHTSDSTAYADIEASGWRETWPIRSRGFRRWLMRIYYDTTGMAPNSEALQTDQSARYSPASAAPTARSISTWRMNTGRRSRSAPPAGECSTASRCRCDSAAPLECSPYRSRARADRSRTCGRS